MLEDHAGSVVDVDLSCGMNTRHKHKLFVTTYLGFGANEARKRYMQARAHDGTGSAPRQPGTGSAPPQPGNGSAGGDALLEKIFDPCAPVDMQESVAVAGRTLTFQGTGEFASCKRAVLPILQAPSNCSEGGAACLSSTFTAPPINAKMEFYGFSEFWYTMEDVLRMGGAYDKHQFEEAATVSHTAPCVIVPVTPPPCPPRHSAATVGPLWRYGARRDCTPRLMRAGCGECEWGLVPHLSDHTSLTTPPLPKNAVLQVCMDVSHSS